MLLWLSAAFVVEFDRRRGDLEEAAAAHGELLRQIRGRLEEERQLVMSHLTIPQLAFVVDAFAPRWPCVGRPPGAMWGNHHPWDATVFIDRTIREIASRPTPEATEVLQCLISGPAATYVHVARHALAQQRKARRDFEYDAPSVADLRAVMTDDLPETIDDMRAYLADRIEVVQERIHRDHTDMWAVYWVGNRPRPENFCRNRLVEQISNQLPDSLRLEPEAHMPGERRADLIASRNAIRLPVEIKGQWLRDVWDAASDQLDARYARERRAGDCGVYVVPWFGDVRGKQLRRHPDGVAQPETPRELQELLSARIPEARRSQIDVVVMDLTRPPASRCPGLSLLSSIFTSTPYTNSTGRRCLGHVGREGGAGRSRAVLLRDTGVVDARQHRGPGTLAARSILQVIPATEQMPMTASFEDREVIQGVVGRVAPDCSPRGGWAVAAPSRVLVGPQRCIRAVGSHG